MPLMGSRCQKSKLCYLKLYQATIVESGVILFVRILTAVLLVFRWFYMLALKNSVFYYFCWCQDDHQLKVLKSHLRILRSLW